MKMFKHDLATSSFLSGCDTAEKNGKEGIEKEIKGKKKKTLGINSRETFWTTNFIQWVMNE